MAKSSTPKKRKTPTAGGLREDCFRTPPGEFRPMPFWGVNDLLDDRELRRQIREMPRQGWGGFFIHPRYGMETPYLTPEYMERIKTIVGEARRQGLQAWIYDEHPFPACCAGGLVSSDRPDFRQKALVLKIHPRLTPLAEGIGYFAAALDQNGIPAKLHKIENPEAYRGRERIFLHFYEWTHPIQPSSITGITDDFIHGFAYTDTLNPKAMQRFIELTYEGYRRAVGKEFGKTVKGTFSDIPTYQWHYATPRPSIPWTPDFPQYFRKHCGYDLLPHLPALFFDVGDYPPLRHDFWRVMNQRFLESCTKQLYDWCTRHKISYSAHYWGEETLHWQIPWTGDVMTHFAYQHVIAIDHILRNIEDPMGVKQAATVAEQLGRPRVISETYALCGHNLTYEERKWIGDWEYALGANFLVPYIPAYSMRGRRKRDEPPSEFIQQPYWPYEGLLNDYYGRLSYALTQGKRVVNLLLLQPLASAWTLYKPGSTQPAAYRPDPDTYEGAGVTLYEFSEGFRKLCERLLREHRDFHLGNEALLAEHGKVEGNQLCVSEMAYSVVLVPPSLNWSRTTVDLLAKFAAQGGKIVAMKPLPTRVDGKEQRDILPAVATIVDDQNLGETLGRLLPRDIEIDGGAEILYQHRKINDDDLYFLANTSLTKSYPDTWVRIPGSGALELWDALSGERYDLPCTPSADGRLEVRLSFAPVGSYLFVRRPQRAAGLAVFTAPPAKFDSSIPLASRWKLKRLDPNTLTLDYCELKIGGSEWTPRLPVWQAHRRVRQAGIGIDFKLRFRFEVRERPSRLCLAMENPRRYAIRFNGEPVTRKAVATWWDPCLKLFEITTQVRVGHNEVELSGKGGLDTEIENCYLVGDFALAQNQGFQLVVSLKR